MRLPRQDTIFDWLKALALWCALGASLGLYYRFAAGGPRGWLLPHPESFAAALLHFAARDASLSGNQEVWIWILSFPVVGLLWVSLQTLLAPQFDGRRALFSVSMMRSGAASAPLILLGLWLVVEAVRTQNGWHWNRLSDLAFGRSFARPSPYIDYAFASAAFLALALEMRLFWTAFDVHGRKAVRHALTSTALLSGIAFGIGKGLGFLFTG